VIQNYLLTYNIRQVLLDIGWSNYKVGNPPYEKWVDDWLAACDQLKVNNIFYLGQFTASGVGSPWVESLIQQDPITQTFSSNGQPAQYVSVDNPDVAAALEKDLTVLYSYYGSHGSWTGIGTGYLRVTHI